MTRVSRNQVMPNEEACPRQNGYGVHRLQLFRRTVPTPQEGHGHRTKARETHRTTPSNRERRQQDRQILAAVLPVAIHCFQHLLLVLLPTAGVTSDTTNVYAQRRHRSSSQMRCPTVNVYIQ